MGDWTPTDTDLLLITYRGGVLSLLVHWQIKDERYEKAYKVNRYGVEIVKRVVVIGAGASGLMAGIFAARAGAYVSIIEHKEVVGKKILATGNGRCNYSNWNMDVSCYYENTFAMQVIEQFSVGETVEFFRELGIWPLEKDGYLYPASEQATAVRQVLLQEVERLGVKQFLESEVLSIIHKKEKFQMQILRQGKKIHIQADAVILATGGKAMPVSGSDGSGYEIAEKFGHHIIKPVPALTAIHCQEKFFKQLAGVRVQAEVKLFLKGKQVCKDKGQLQLTAYGISGIPVFQLSRYAARAFEKGEVAEIRIDFIPELSYYEVCEYLSSHTLQQYVGLLNAKLLGVLCKQFGYQPKALARGIKQFTVYGYQVNGFEQAQVTCGGVDVREIDVTSMQSKLCKGLYLAGELVDVDGICGGYNLQWAWSSGALAGKSAGKEIQVNKNDTSTTG
jgi:hypothetical protein